MHPADEADWHGKYCDADCAVDEPRGDAWTYAPFQHAHQRLIVCIQADEAYVTE